MKKKTVISVLAALMLIGLTGCSTLDKEIVEYSSNNKDIKLTVSDVAEPVETMANEWVELSQLNSHKSLRKTWDDELGILIFGEGSKNGVLFVDTDSNWASNNTLYNAFMNKAFYATYWSDAKVKTKLSDAAISEYSDIDNEGTGIVASVNAYFNILPDNADGTSGMFRQLSRKEVMSAVVKADTPVVFVEENENFTNTVGKSDYNVIAQNCLKESYLDYSDGGLNYDTYNSAMTRGEALYIIANRYYGSEIDNVDIRANHFTDCSNAGDVITEIGLKPDSHAANAYALEYCLQYPEDGCPEPIFKAMSVCYKHGIIGSETRWDKPIIGGELMNMLIKTYYDLGSSGLYTVNAKNGKNIGDNLYDTEVAEADIFNIEQVEFVVSSDVEDVTDLDDLFDVYGDELDLTDEEEAEAREIDAQYNFVPVDAYMQIDHCSYLNVRVGPGTNYRIIRSLPAGTKIHIVAYCEDNGWYRVIDIMTGKLAYQYGYYFSDLPASDPDSQLNKEPDDSKVKEVTVSDLMGEIYSDDNDWSGKDEYTSDKDDDKKDADESDNKDTELDKDNKSDNKETNKNE